VVSPGLGRKEYETVTAWQIGKDVPWSVSWTGETQFELRDSREFPGWVDLLQLENSGTGEPTFASLHVSRQRKAMLGHLCHVCGRGTVTRDRYIFPVVTGNFVTVNDEESRYASTVPSVHLACAKRARMLCPHLSSSMADPVVFPGEGSVLRPLGDIPDGMIELSKTFPRGISVVYSSVRIYGPKFSKYVRRLRARRGF
jgi:hypothetical protein